MLTDDERRAARMNWVVGLALFLLTIALCYLIDRIILWTLGPLPRRAGCSRAQPCDVPVRRTATVCAHWSKSRTTTTTSSVLTSRCVSRLGQIDQARMEARSALAHLDRLGEAEVKYRVTYHTGATHYSTTERYAEYLASIERKLGCPVTVDRVLVVPPKEVPDAQ